MQFKILNTSTVVLLFSGLVYGDGVKPADSGVNGSVPQKFAITRHGWARSYGGESYEDGHSIVQLEDGNFIAVGETSSPGGDGDVERNHDKVGNETADFWILKLDPSGEILEQFSLGGSEDDRAFGVAKTRSKNGVFDGGFVVVGMSNSKDGDLSGTKELSGHHGATSTSDFWVVKYNRHYQVEWTRSIGGSGDDGYKSDYDRMSVIVTDDGDIVVIGDSFSTDGDIKLDKTKSHGPSGCAGTRDYLVVRLAANGQIKWVRVLGGENHEYASQIIQTRDKGFMLVGRTESEDEAVPDFKGEYDAWMVKLNSSGEIEWQKTIGGEMWDWGSGVLQTLNGDYLFAGYVYSTDGDAQGNHGDYDYLIMKIDEKGKTKWRKVIGGLTDDFAHSIVEMRDGTYLIAGNSSSKDGDVGQTKGNADIWLAKLRESADQRSADLVWSRTFGGSEYEIPGLGASMVTTQDGGVILTGTTESNDHDFNDKNNGGYDFFVIKVAAEDLKSRSDQLVHTARESNHGVPGGSKDSRKFRRIHGPVKKELKGLKGHTPPSKVDSSNSKHQSPGIEWQRTFGGTNLDRPLDAPQALTKKRGGGFAFIGSTNSNDGTMSGLTSHGDQDIFVTSLDKNGNTLWQRKFGGPGRDTGAAIAQVNDPKNPKDNGLAFVGWVTAAGGDVKKYYKSSSKLGRPKPDYWVVKLGDTGEIQWQRTLGGTGSDEATSIAATADGGFIVGGNSQSKDGDVNDHLCARDYWIVKLDRHGNVQWTKSLGGSSNDYLIEIIATKDGGYVTTGRTESEDGDVGKNHGSYDFWVVKLAPWNGVSGQAPAVAWQRSLGDWDWEWGNSIIEVSDGNFVVAGYTYTFDSSEGGQVQGYHGEFDYWVIKIDGQNTGKLLWQRCFGGSNYELGYGIIETSDHGFAIVGGSPSTDGQVTDSDGNPDNHGQWDTWVVKLSSKGKFVWGKSLGGSGYDSAYSLVETVDRVNGVDTPKLVILGETFSNDKDVAGKNHCSGDKCDDDIWLVKLSGI